MPSPERSIGPQGQRTFHQLAAMLRLHFGAEDVAFVYQRSETRWHLLACGKSGCRSLVSGTDEQWWTSEECAAASRLRRGEPGLVRCRGIPGCPLPGGDGEWCAAASFMMGESVAGGLACRVGASLARDRAETLRVLLAPLGELMSSCVLFAPGDPSPEERQPPLSWAGAFTHADGSRRQILGGALELACRVMGVDVGGVCLADTSDGTPRVLALKGIPEELLGTALPLAASLTGRVMRSGTAQVLTREEVVSEGHPPLVARLPSISVSLATPLRVGGRVVGALHLSAREGAAKKEFTEEDLENARVLSELISGVLDRARLAGDWRRQAELNAQMLEVSRSVAERRFDRNIRVVLDRLRVMAGAEYAVLLRHPDGDSSQFEVVDVQPDLPSRLGSRLPADAVLPAEESRKGVAVIYRREELLAWGHPEAPAWAESLGGVPEEVMVVPVNLSGATAAALVLVHAEGGTARFSWAQAAALRMVVQYLESTLENARILDILDEKQRQLGRLLRETHHRLKNSLQTVVSLIEMEERALPADVAGSLRTLRRRIGHMAKVHEMMSAAPGGAVFLDALLRSAVRCVASLGDGIEVRVVCETGEPLAVVPERAMPLAMVVHELALNAVKHARPREVRVAVRDGEGRVVIEVGNDGVSAGMPHRRGAGLELVEEMVRHELRGTFDLAQSGDRMTARIELPADVRLFAQGDGGGSSRP